MPPPGKDTMICHCGPRPMNVMVRKILEELGYASDMLIKFWFNVILSHLCQLLASLKNAGISPILLQNLSLSLSSRIEDIS